jgi:hypothetical protein
MTPSSIAPSCSVAPSSIVARPSNPWIYWPASDATGRGRISIFFLARACGDARVARASWHVQWWTINLNLRATDGAGCTYFLFFRFLPPRFFALCLGFISLFFVYLVWYGNTDTPHRFRPLQPRVFAPAEEGAVSASLSSFRFLSFCFFRCGFSMRCGAVRCGAVLLSQPFRFLMRCLSALATGAG